MNFEPDAIRERAEERGELLDITSMVDVVFILLAFFVLSTQFIDRERDVVVASQQLGGSVTSAADLPEAVTVHLALAANGEDVRILVGRAALPANAFDGITAKLTEIDLPEVEVILAAEGEVPVEAVVRALDAVLSSPMRQVSLAESGGGRAPAASGSAREGGGDGPAIR